MSRARTWRWRRMRRYGELSSGVERSSPRQFFLDYTIAMRGYDFREGHHLADIEAVLEQMGERPHAKAPPADGPAVRQPPRLAANSPAIEILRQRADGGLE